MKEKESYAVTLAVNGAALELNRFIADFIARVSAGMLLSLKGVKDIQSAEIELCGGGVKAKVNGADVPTDSYAQDMIAATLTGMVSALKGGSGIERLLVTITSSAR